MKAKSLLTVAAMGAAAVLGINIAGPALAATGVNTGTAGWTIFTRDTGTLSIDQTYGAPTNFGNAALVLGTPLSNDKAQFMSLNQAGMDLDTAMSDVSYWTYRDSASTGQPFQTPSINVEIDFNGADTGGFAILVFEPVYQSGGAAAVNSGDWQFWDADTSATWWSTRSMPGVPLAFDSFISLNVILAANPDAVLVKYGINQGGGNPGIFAASDGLTIAGQTVDFQQIVPTTIQGFYQPVFNRAVDGADQPQVVNGVKNGSTVPLKFNICDGEFIDGVCAGTLVTDPSQVTSLVQRESCTTLVGTTDMLTADELSTGSTSLRWDADSQQFIFNWKTPKNKGTCFSVTATADGGAFIQADFTLK